MARGSIDTFPEPSSEFGKQYVQNSLDYLVTEASEELSLHDVKRSLSDEEDAEFFEELLGKTETILQKDNSLVMISALHFVKVYL